MPTPNSNCAFLAAACIVASSFFLSGCAHWNPEPEEKRSFHIPATRMSPDSVSLEIGVAQLSDSQKESLALLWSQLDQQKSDLDVRKRLDANGFRVAVIQSQIPKTLFDLLSPEKIVPERLNDFQRQMYDKGLLKPAEKLVDHQKIQNRNGHGHELAVSGVFDAKSWIVTGEKGVIAGAGESVIGVLEIKTFPQGDGSVRLNITPQIHHGRPTTQIGVVDRSFMFQQQKTITPLSDLSMDFEIVPGETVLIGATPDFAGVAELFFRIPTVGGAGQAEIELGSSPGVGEELDPTKRRIDHQRIVLIRLVHTQRDDLFSRRLTGEKLISTPLE